MIQQQIRKAIKSLISNPTTFNPSSPGNNHPFSNTADIYQQYESFFNEEAKMAFSARSNSMIHQYNEKVGPSTLYEVTVLLEKLGLKSAQDNTFAGNYIRKFAIVMCFGFMCQISEADDATKKLITHINDLALDKRIKASLYNIGRMDLYGGQECVIFSYLAIPSEHEEYVKKNYGHIQFPEGGTPPRFK
jgi:hypothetical protein